MMKNNLGKLIYIVLAIFLPLILNAKVVLQSPDTFYKNDVVSFRIIASGEEINIPVIKNIDGNVVTNAGTSKRTSIINGVKSYQFIQGYALKSQKDIHIPSFEIKIDNKIEKTQAKTIKMIEANKTKSDLYDLKISVDKQNVYVGEAIVFTLKFKYKKDLDIVNLEFSKPNFESFWVKDLKSPQSQNNYTKYAEQEIKYLLFPQKSGKIELGPLKIGVITADNNASRGFFLSSSTINTPVYSNKINLNIKPLPQGTNLIGDFSIKSTIDKSVIDQGDAISYKLYIEGRGNIDDLDEVKIDIPNTTIYDNPSKKEYSIKNNLYGGKYSKIYSIVGNKDFVIPSVKIKYFDKKTQTVKVISTQTHKIKVNVKSIKESKLEVASAPIKEKEVIKKDEKTNGKTIFITNEEKILYFFIGLISGVVSFGIFVFFKNRNKSKTTKDTTLMQSIKRTKTAEELFKILVVYINIDEELDNIIYTLENISLLEYKKEKKNLFKKLQILIEKDIKLNI